MEERPLGLYTFLVTETKTYTLISEGPASALEEVLKRQKNMTPDMGIHVQQIDIPAIIGTKND